MKHKARHYYKMHLVTLNFNILYFTNGSFSDSFALQSSNVITYVEKQIRLIDRDIL